MVVAWQPLVVLLPPLTVALATIAVALTREDEVRTASKELTEVLPADVAPDRLNVVKPGSDTTSKNVPVARIQLPAP